MSIINDLITDRALEDWQRVLELRAKGLSGMTPAELEEYRAGMKGAYNASDLSRVNEAMEYILARILSTGTVLTLEPMKTFTLGYIPPPEDVEPYLRNLSTLRGALAVMASTPSVPLDMEGLTWSEANDIEKILSDIDRLLTNAAAAWRHCGAAVCGGGGLLIR